MRKTAYYVLNCLVWGTTWMAIKVGLQDLTPFFSLGIRHLVAGGILVTYILISDRKLTFNRSQWKMISAITLFNYIIPYSAVYWAEQHIYSDLTAVIFAMIPLNVSMLSAVFLKAERFSSRDYAGVSVGFGGIIAIFSGSMAKGQSFSLLGMAVVYLASVSAAGMILYLRKNKDTFHPLKINLFPVIFTGVIVTGFSLFVENVQDNRFTSSAVLSITYLSLFGTVVGFALYFWLLQKVKLSVVSAISYITPVIAIAVGWIFLDESLTTFQILGAVMVLSGVSITVKNSKTPVPPKE